ncbi:MAG TPA: polysaccharide deacetylase family protein [Acidobacteriaceae bacterium]|jgi:peptidoglycan/xylan/chitin deacetylase (PgdA/CDA1 family)
MRLRSAIFLLAALALAPLAHAQQLAITFDDLPSHGPLAAGTTRLQVAQAILDVMQREHLPPIYGMVNAVHIAEDPTTAAVLKAWTAAGNPLGNHTYAHVNLNTMSAEAFEDNIEKNEPYLKQYAGSADWHWFRYPFLAEGDTPEKSLGVRTWLAQHNYKIAEVNMSFGDYNWNPPYARCVAKHDDAAMKQLHDTYLAAADEAITASRKLAQGAYGHDIPYVLLMHIGAFDAHMFPELVALYKSRGFTFVTLPEAESDPAYHDNAIAPLASSAGHLAKFAAEHKVPYPHTTDYSKMLDSLCR